MRGLGKALRGAVSLLPAPLLRPFGRPAAVFFHGVERQIDDPRVQSNHHDSAVFFDIATTLKRNFDVLPLAELPRVLRNPSRYRRAVFLTCDDGYANNLAEAAVILEELALPWNLFVSTRHIDTAERSGVFTARLFCLFAPQGNYRIPNLSGAIRLDRDRMREADRVVQCLRALDAPRADEAVRAMEEALGKEALAHLLARFRSDSFLTWPEVRTLKERYGVEIGAHAHVHWAMHGAQSIDYLAGQARLSRARVEAEIGPCHAFAFPFGNTGDVCAAAWRAVRDAGYDYAFTTLSGSLDASANPYLMPRYGLAPREPRLNSVVPILRIGNGRLRNWQRRLS